MTLSEADIENAAEALHAAESTGRQIGILSLRHPGLDMDDAYAIQAALVRRRLAAGRTMIGWKIGLTSKAMQYALNIDIPDSGMLFDDMLFENGATVPAGRFIQPRIEAEIAFIMKAPLAGETTTRDEVIATMDELREIGVDILTFGQYLRPTLNHLPVERYIHPDDFLHLRELGLARGFTEVVSGALVRSSYRAEQALAGNNVGLEMTAEVAQGQAKSG